MISKHKCREVLILNWLMFGKNRQLVTDEQVQFEKQPVEVRDFRRIIDHFRGFYRIKQNWKMSTCNRLDLKSLGSSPKMPKNYPGTGTDIKKCEILIVDTQMVL